jgi:DNA polymerase-1
VKDLEGFEGDEVLVNAALSNFKGRLEILTNSIDVQEVILCMSGSGNFRKALRSSYKSHRPPPPQIISETRARVLREYPGVLTWPGLEGDDVVGIHSDIPGAIIWSEDKDLLQLPGIHLGGGEEFVITPEDGMRFFYTQVLAGDPADGYPGCPGIGKIKAYTLMEDAHVEDMWDLVCLTYELHGSTESEAVSNAQMAWLLRSSESGIRPFIPPKRRSKPFGNTHIF